LKKRIAFIESGDFSHINRSVRLQLQRCFPEHDLVVLDVREMARRSVVPLLRSLTSMLSAHGIRGLMRRRDPVDCLIQSPGFFAFVRDELRRRVSPREYAFTFQTQSMWDGSVPGLPHFVYTDNTELAQLRQPGFERGQLLGEWWLALERQIYQRADRVFTMSQNVRRSLLEDYGVAGHKVRCVFSGSNAEVRPGSRGGPERHLQKALLFVGVVWERKGGPELVEAFEAVLRKHPDATLTIVGCRPRVRLRNCRVLGRLPLEGMSRLYEAASLFCLPSRNEPFGIAFVEAMHHALPLVGTALGAIPDLITPGENGLLVPARDPAALASALDQLLSDPEAMQRMGCRSLARARDRYTWDRVGERLREEIESVTRHEGAGR
jgi:glycosyltransferase involved in cell wall biosynthesis